MMNFPPGGPAPPSVVRAVWVMAAAAALYVVYSVADEVVNSSLTTAQAVCATPGCHSLAGGGEVFGDIVGVGLWLWMMWKLHAGRRWARVLSAVFFAATCVQLLAALAIGPGIIRILISVCFLAALAALILVYRPDATAFFAGAELADAGGRIGDGPPPQGWRPPQR